MSVKLKVKDVQVFTSWVIAGRERNRECKPSLSRTSQCPRIQLFLPSFSPDALQSRPFFPPLHQDCSCQGHCASTWPNPLTNSQSPSYFSSTWHHPHPCLSWVSCISVTAFSVSLPHSPSPSWPSWTSPHISLVFLPLLFHLVSNLASLHKHLVHGNLQLPPLHSHPTPYSTSLLGCLIGFANLMS